MRKIKIILYLFINIILLSGCFTSKSLKLAQKNIPEKIQIKYSATALYNNEEYDFNGKITINHDSLIKISVLYFGAPVALIYLSKDSVKVKSRLSQNIEMSTSDLENKFGINITYSTIEAALTGNIFLYPQGNKLTNYKKQKPLPDSREDIYLYKKNSDNQRIIHQITVDSNKVKRHKVWHYTPKNEFELKVYNRNFKKYSTVYLPQTITLELLTDKYYKLDLNYKSVKIYQ